MHPLTLAHSGDPDDAFMWWPLTGKVQPDGTPCAGREGEPRVRSERFSFRAVPGDISEFNRVATKPSSEGGRAYDISALSLRAWADAHAHYVITNVGSSFGDGYGPKVVCNASDAITAPRDLLDERVTIAVPGVRTTAFLTLGLLLREARTKAAQLGGDETGGVRAAILGTPGRFIETSFDTILPTVAGGKARAGLVIHEAQVTFADAGLREVVDLGAWWQRAFGLPLPLGVNAIKRDLDERFGPGSVREVARLLESSLDYAFAHRDEAIEYTIPFARVNAQRSGTREPTRETIERYVDMYVTDLTVDMGERGRTAIEWLLREGSRAGLCADVPSIDVV